MDGSISKQSHVTLVSLALSSTKLFKAAKATIKKISGAHITHVNVFICAQVSAALAESQNQWKVKFQFALRPGLTINDLRRAFDECDLLPPQSLIKNKPDPINLLQPDDEEMQLCLHDISSASITPEKKARGQFV